MNVCVVQLCDTVSSLPACRLSCHKKCEVKVRQLTSFTALHATYDTAAAHTHACMFVQDGEKRVEDGLC